MTKEEAKEYTESLGQIVTGSWRQIRLAQKLGVNKALEMSMADWVNSLGGYIRMSIEQRREAIVELRNDGANQREAAEVLGVVPKTINRTMAAEVSDGHLSANSPKQIDLIAGSAKTSDGHLSQNPPMAVFNQVNENIGWAKWSWNPVTGCKHDCAYCYARDIANRFYPQKFEPTFYPERLDAPANTKVPKYADKDPAWHRVFTCSMADLFGNWVDQAWIDAVFRKIHDHQEWEFLCLTKFPQRLAQLDWPTNVWAGTTVDKQSRVANAEKSFRKLKAGIKWLSCEPLLEPLKFTSLAMFDWVVIGACTKSSLMDAVAPDFDWVVDLYQQARSAGCKVYLKHNLFRSEQGDAPGMKPIHEWPR